MKNSRKTWLYLTRLAEELECDPREIIELLEGALLDEEEVSSLLFPKVEDVEEKN